MALDASFSFTHQPCCVVDEGDEVEAISACTNRGIRTLTHGAATMAQPIEHRSFRIFVRLMTRRNEDTVLQHLLSNKKEGSPPEGGGERESDHIEAGLLLGSVGFVDRATRQAVV